MPRRRIGIALLLCALLLGSVPACGSGTGGIEEASDYLFTCPIQVVNGTTKRLVSYAWALIERRGGGDVLWHALDRQFGPHLDPGLEQPIVPGPSYADVPDPSVLEWEVVIIDAEDVRYGTWTVPLADCGSTTITVTAADAL